jgi:hypothetical protein
MSNLPVDPIPLAGGQATLGEVVGIPPDQVGSEGVPTLEYLRSQWRLKYMTMGNGTLLRYRNPSNKDPFYWDEMGSSSDVLWPKSATSSESEHSDASEDETSPPPEENQLPVDDRLRLEELWNRQDESSSRANKVWADLEAIHGWTNRGKQAWRVAHMGPTRIIPPWEFYTRVSRDAWLREIYPTV